MSRYPNKRNHLMRSLDVCQSNICGNWVDNKQCTGCGLFPVPCRTANHLFQGNGCVNNVSYFDPMWVPVGLPRHDVDDDCVVVSGTDAQYIKGAYLLFWSLLRSNKVNCRLYVHNIDESDFHLKQIRSWGVDIQPMPLVVPDTVEFFQAWNKCSMILDATHGFERVLWLDSDTAVNGPIQEAFDIIDKQPMAANHGRYSSTHSNSDRIHQLLGHPKRNWESGDHPCAGVVGFKSSRDQSLLQEWERRNGVVVQHKDLWLQQSFTTTDHTSDLRYHDQGVLTDLWEWDTVDGERWSEFRTPRIGSVDDVMQHLYRRERITHYGGKQKPFHQWNNLHWGSPIPVSSSDKQFITIMGCQRSGTTMMLRLLGTTPNSAEIHERDKRVIDPADNERLRYKPVSTVVRALSSIKEDNIVVKPLVESAYATEWLDVVPNNKIVWMFRNPKDMVASYLRLFGETSAYKDAQCIVNAEGWRGTGLTAELRGKLGRAMLSRKSANDAAAVFWYARSQLYFHQELDKSESVLLVDYDQLLSKPVKQLLRIQQFLDIDFSIKSLSDQLLYNTKPNDVSFSAIMDAMCNDLYQRLIDATRD